ncbi:hypothetical protein Tco_0471300, partial [Tanacetum coccineum]
MMSSPFDKSDCVLGCKNTEMVPLRKMRQRVLGIFVHISPELNLYPEQTKILYARSLHSRFPIEVTPLPAGPNRGARAFAEPIVVLFDSSVSN